VWRTGRVAVAGGAWLSIAVHVFKPMEKAAWWRPFSFLTLYYQNTKFGE
jgi:hypothetical protein